MISKQTNRTCPCWVQHHMETKYCWRFCKKGHVTSILPPHKENSKIHSPALQPWGCNQGTVWATFVVQQQPARRLSNEAQEQNTQLLLFLLCSILPPPCTKERYKRSSELCVWAAESAHCVCVHLQRFLKKKLRRQRNRFSSLQQKSDRFIIWKNS